MELPLNCEYFDKKTSNNFDRLIREQNDGQVLDYTFGFVYIENNSQPDFILCKIEHELNYIDIHPLCSTPNTKIYKILLELVEQYARTLKIPWLYLDYIMGEPKLLEWYKNQGFLVFKNKMHMAVVLSLSGDKKAYTMIKFLDV